MRVFIAVLVLIFSLQSWTKAEDISDFEIEGMSIGDSLLDHYSRQEINKSEIYYYPGSNKFFIISFDIDSPNYDVIQFALKNDKKYIIYGLSGKLLYNNNFEKCKKKMNFIISDLENSLPKNVVKQDDELFKMRGDKSGKSVNKGTAYWFPNDDFISVECTDWSDEMKFLDNLKVRFTKKIYNEWLINEAHD